jgi:hypothetical protein
MKSLLCVAAIAFLLVPAATADTWNKKTMVTFPEPVELPGRVTLPSGSYVMKLADSQSNRHIVQVLNKDENRVYATILAIPSERQKPAEKTIITFYETPVGYSSFIRNWYYPGDTIGQEFTYPKDRAMYIARAAKTNVPIAPDDANSPVSMEATPAEKEVGLTDEPAEAEVEPNVATSTSQSKPAEPVPPSEPQEPSTPAERPKLQTLPEAHPVEAETLPATAGAAPYLAFAGALFLSAAFLIKGVRVKGRRLWRHLKG